MNTREAEIAMTNRKFPETRMRRLRRTDWSRRLVRETALSVDDLIWPLFVIDGKNTREPVASMPDVERLSVDLAVQAAQEAADLGIPVIALFPNTPAHLRSADGAEAFNADNEQHVISRLKQECGHDFTYKWSRMFHDATDNSAQLKEKYLDYMRVGIPLNLLFWVLATILIPQFWSF